MKDLYLTTNNLYNIPIIFENENNVESVLYEYKYSYVLKIFNTDDIATLFKLLIRIMFWKNKDFLHILNPEFFVFIDNQFKGFGMKKFDGVNINKFINTLSSQEKINILKDFSLILKELHDSDVIVGDLSYDNVLTNGREIMFCDVNSMGYKDKMSPLMIPYTLIRNRNIQRKDKGTIKSDIFLINTLVYNTLLEDSIFPYFLNIDDYQKKINGLLLPNDIKNIFNHIYDIFYDELVIYPHQYLDGFKEYKKTRK